MTLRELSTGREYSTHHDRLSNPLFSGKNEVARDHEPNANPEENAQEPEDDSPSKVNPEEVLIRTRTGRVSKPKRDPNFEYAFMFPSSTSAHSLLVPRAQMLISASRSHLMQTAPGSLPSAQEVLANERRVRREQQMRLEALGELPQWMVDEAGNDYLAVMLKANGTILFLDLAQEDWINRKSGTTLTELLGRERWQRAPGVAPLTDEEVTLPNSIEEFPGDFDSPRYGFRKQWQDFVKARAGIVVVDAPPLVAPPTRPPATAPSAPGVSPIAALKVSTGAAWSAAYRASVAAPVATVTSTASAAGAPLSSSRVQPPRGPSTQRLVSTVPPAGPRTASTQSFVAAATAWVSSMQQFAAAAPVLMAAASTQTRPPVAAQSRIPVPSFTTSSRVASESTGQFSGSASTSPVFASLPAGSISHGPSAAGSLKPGSVVSPSIERMEVTQGEEEEEREENRPDPLAVTMREFLLQFSQPVGGEVSMLHLRPLVAALMDLGFTFDEFPPPADRPEQRILSIMAYLQIASDESAEILPMNLQEFNRLVTAVVREQYGAFASSYRPRELSLDRIRSMVGRVVFDSTGILRGESASVTRPTAPPMPGPSAASAPSLLPPQAAGVTLDMLKGLVAAAAASAAAKFTVPPPPIQQPAPEPVEEPAPSSTAPSVQPSQTETSFSETQTGEQTEQLEEELAPGLPIDPSQFTAADFSALLDEVATPVLGVPPFAARKTPEAPSTKKKPSRQQESGARREKSKPRRAGPSPKRAKGQAHDTQHSAPDVSATSAPTATPVPSTTSAPATTSKTPESRHPDRERRKAAVEAEKSLRKKTPPLELPTSEEEVEEVRPPARTGRARTVSEESSDLTFSEDSEKEKTTKPKKKSRHDKSAARPSRKAADPSASTTGEPEAEQVDVPPPTPLPQLASVSTLPPKWYAGIPMTVAVPGRRDDLVRETGVKPKAVVFKPRLLSAVVESIWTDLRHGALSYLNPATEEISARWRMIQEYLAKVPGATPQVREFMSMVPWKLIVDWSWCLFKCYGPRIATALERASFNYMAHFPQELVPQEKLKEKARKDIGETTEYLEVPDGNQLTPRDIWTRLTRELDKLEGFDQSLLILEGCAPTAIVACGLPNACAIFKLLDEYAKRASGYAGKIRHIELADGGTLKLSILARDLISWHFGIEELLIAALDMDSRCRSAPLGTHSVPRDSLEFYLGTQIYDVEKDIDLLELSCTASIESKLIESKKTTTLGGHVNKWRNREATKGLKVPLLLTHGGCCSAYGAKGAFDAKKMNEFVTAFEASVKAHGRDPSREPQPLEPDVPLDTSLDDAITNVYEQIDVYGSVRSGSRLLDMSLFPGVDPEDPEPSPPPNILPQHALICVARISLLRGPFEGAPRRPYVISLVLANGLGRPLVICDGFPQNGTPPRGAVDFGGRRTSPEDMRLLLLEHLGSNNFLVGFNLGWTLTALDLVLPASRVIDIGTEEPFQRWCRSLAVRYGKFNDYLAKDLVNSYDRRLPAVLFEDGIEFATAERDDVVGETVYTAAIWTVVGAEISYLRSLQVTHAIKKMYQIGCGEAIKETEEVLLTREMDLTARDELPNVTTLPTVPEEVMEMLRVSPLDDFTWTGDPNGDLVRKCATMASFWSQSLLNQLHGSPYRMELGEHAERCEVAVLMALPSRSVRADASLVVPWINHRGPHDIAQLRAVQLKEPRLRIPAAKCLVTSLLDLALLPQQLAAAQQKPRPPSPDVVELPPPNVTRAPEGTATGQASTSRPDETAETRSTAQRNLTVEPIDPSASLPPRQDQPPRQPIPHQPVRLEPVAPFAVPVTGAPAQPERPERASSVASASPSARTLRSSPGKTPARSAASTPTPPGPATRSQSRSPKIAGKDRPAKS